MRGLGLSFLIRRAGSSWLLLACVAVTVLLTTGLAAVLWAFAAAAIPSGARSFLDAPQGRVVGLSGVVDAGEAAADSKLIRTTLGQAWPGVSFQMESALWTNPFELPSSAAGTATAQIQLAELEGIGTQATLIAGEWPPPPRRGGPVPVALPAAVASQLHLTVGSVLTGTLPTGEAPTAMKVTGLFRPRDPASPYWALDLLPVSGSSVRNYSIGRAGNPGRVATTSTSYGPAVVNPAAFGGALTAGQGSWMVLPQAPAMARGNISALDAGTSQAVSQLSVVLPEGLKATSRLPQILAGIASVIVLARSLFTMAALLLLLVSAAGLVLVARLLTSLREEESALLRARGATRWQLARPVLAEAMVLAAAAGLAGVLAGTGLAGVLARLGGLRLDYDPGITPLAWLSALDVLVVCVAVMAWPALRALTPDTARHRRGRQARLAALAWAGGDLALVALAAVSVWQLRGYSAVAHPDTGSLGIDPVAAIAPALAVAGAALIPLRGLPLLARLADKVTDHARRLGTAMVSWQIARRPIRQAGPVLLVVVATATATMALAGYASWRQSTADQASFAVGSDVRVDSAGPVPLGAAGAITRAPGVIAATEASVADLGNGGQMIALDASTAGKAILLRPDLSPLPLSTLWQRITPRLTGPPQSGLALPLPGQPDRLEILAVLDAGPDTGAAEVQRDLRTAIVTAWVQDAGGATDEIDADGSLTADGRPHPLVFSLSGPGQASYPLRLIGLSLTYLLPSYDTANPASAPHVDLGIESLAVAATAGGPFGRPFADGAALAAWQDKGIAPSVPTGPPGPYGGPPESDGAPPTILSWHGAASGARQLTFSTGHNPSVQVELEVPFYPANATGQVAITARPPSQVVPAIATSGYLAANRLGIGSVISVSLSGIPVSVQIVASVARFPTVFGPNQALVADLAEVNDVLAPQITPPLPSTRWWLSTAGGRVPRMPACSACRSPTAPASSPPCLATCC